MLCVTEGAGAGSREIVWTKVEGNDRKVAEMVQQGTSVIRIVQLRRTIGRACSGNGKDKKFIHCSPRKCR